MRKSYEIAEDLKARMASLEAETDAAKREALAAEVDNFTQELREAQVDEAAERALLSQRQLSEPEKKELKRFSIAKFLREAAGTGLTGFEAEMNEEARKELAGSGRSIEGVGIPAVLMGVDFVGKRTGDFNNATDSGYGPEFKAITQWSYIEALKDAMVAAKAGVRYIPGMQGNARIVKGGAAAASWLAEEASASLTKMTYSTVDMTPKRLQILGGYTMDLLKQSALPVEQYIWDEIISAHAQSLDAAIFNGSGSSGQPTGVLAAAGTNSIAMGDNGDYMTWAKLVQMETEVAADNGLFGSLAYVTNCKVSGDLKTIAKASNTAVFLMDGDRANGYPVLSSNAIPSNGSKGGGSNLSTAIFGNWNEVLVPQWGGLDFIVDPYSQKAKAVIEVTAIAYHDVCVRRPAAFCKITDIKTNA